MPIVVALHAARFTSITFIDAGSYGILLLAGCDVKGRFLMAVANNSGGTHDALAMELSEFSRFLKSGRLRKDLFIIGDEAFTCIDQVLTPWPGRGLSVWKDAFNYWLSHSRQSIERAFGVLVSRLLLYI